MARDIDLDTVRTEVRRVVKRNARPVDDDEWNDLVQEVLYEIKRRELNFHSLTELGAWTNVVCRRIAAGTPRPPFAGLVATRPRRTLRCVRRPGGTGVSVATSP